MLDHPAGTNSLSDRKFPDPDLIPHDPCVLHNFEPRTIIRDPVRSARRCLRRKPPPSTSVSWEGLGIRKPKGEKRRVGNFTGDSVTSVSSVSSERFALAVVIPKQSHWLHGRLAGSQIASPVRLSLLTDGNEPRDSWTKSGNRFDG